MAKKKKVSRRNRIELKQIRPVSSAETRERRTRFNSTSNNERIEFRHRQTVIRQERLSIIHGRPLSTAYQSRTHSRVKPKRSNVERILFFIEPIFNGLVIFPLVVLFWQSGWNLSYVALEYLDYRWADTDEEEKEEGFYSLQSIMILFFVGQSFLLLVYLMGQRFKELLGSMPTILRLVLLEIHIFLSSCCYIIQWNCLWIIWDQWTPSDIEFKLSISVGSLFCLTTVCGHLTELVYSPYLICLNSIDWCVDIGTPFELGQINYYQGQLINYIFYEYLISNLSVSLWKGFYDYLDEFVYPDDVVLSTTITIVIGYLIYWPMMFLQNFFENYRNQSKWLNLFSSNFPESMKNVRHFVCVMSCIFMWRGLWVLYDAYVDIFDESYQSYLLTFFLSYLLLILVQGSSSINGPLNTIDDKFNLFHVYPHSFLSTIFCRAQFDDDPVQEEKREESIKEAEF